MNFTKFAAAVVAGMVCLFGLGFLIYVVLMPNPEFTLGTVPDGVMREAIDLPHIIIMELLYAVLLTIIFQRWAGIKTFSTGMKAGAIIGLLLGACATLELFATTNLTTVAGIGWAAVTWAIRFAVAGGAIGWILGSDLGGE